MHFKPWTTAGAHLSRFPTVPFLFARRVPERVQTIYVHTSMKSSSLEKYSWDLLQLRTKEIETYIYECQVGTAVEPCGLLCWPAVFAHGHVMSECCDLPHEVLKRWVVFHTGALRLFQYPPNLEGSAYEQ